MLKLSFILIFQLLPFADSYYRIAGFQLPGANVFLRPPSHFNPELCLRPSNSRISNPFGHPVETRNFMKSHWRSQQKMRWQTALAMASTSTAQVADQPLFAKDSLVVLKGTEPAVVVEAGLDKMEVQLLNKKTKKVRAKDAEAVHPGPVRSWELEELKQPRPADAGKVEAAFETFSGSGDATTAYDLAAAIFGETSPAAAWAAWQVVQEDLYFHGRPAEVYAYSRTRVNEVFSSVPPARVEAVKCKTAISGRVAAAAVERIRAKGRTRTRTARARHTQIHKLSN